MTQGEVTRTVAASASGMKSNCVVSIFQEMIDGILYFAAGDYVVAAYSTTT